jgi:hypothetical protein
MTIEPLLNTVGDVIAATAHIIEVKNGKAWHSLVHGRGRTLAEATANLQRELEPALYRMIHDKLMALSGQAPEGNVAPPPETKGGSPEPDPAPVKAEPPKSRITAEMLNQPPQETADVSQNPSTESPSPAPVESEPVEITPTTKDGDVQGDDLEYITRVRLFPIIDSDPEIEGNSHDIKKVGTAKELRAKIRASRRAYWDGKTGDAPEPDAF